MRVPEVADLYLVRHGQASFGAADYDKLSALGERQSALLGAWCTHLCFGAEDPDPGPLMATAQALLSD